MLVPGQVLGDLKDSLLDTTHDSIVFSKIHHYLHEPIPSKAG